MAADNNTFPDPRPAAQAEIVKLRLDPERVTVGRLNQAASDVPGLEPEQLSQWVVQFHHERMSQNPSASLYPEATRWIAYVIEQDRLVSEALGFSETQMALLRSLGDFMRFRGFARKVPAVEKCRVAWLPETDMGRLHIKNVDDPLPAVWPPPSNPFRSPGVARPLVWDGTGSGLHIDDEPTELFPLPVRDMAMHHCDETPGAVEFLTRYGEFWGSANVLLRDAKDRAVAIEKSSRNFIDVYPQDENGRVWISGMVTRNPESGLGRKVRAKRAEYLGRIGGDDDGPDATFWRGADALHEKLSGFMTQPGVISAQSVFDFFRTPYPAGLNKDPMRIARPEGDVVAYTLCSHGTLLDQNETRTYLRGADLKLPAEPTLSQAN